MFHIGQLTGHDPSGELCTLFWDIHQCVLGKGLPLDASYRILSKGV